MVPKVQLYRTGTYSTIGGGVGRSGMQYEYSTVGLLPMAFRASSNNISGHLSSIFTTRTTVVDTPVVTLVGAPDSCFSIKRSNTS